MNTDFHLTLRKAIASDIPAIVSLLAEDALGQTREFTTTAGDVYHQAFAAIDADPHQELWVVEDKNEVMATLQLTFIPNMTLQGSWRCLVEGVRVKSTYRGQGVGIGYLNKYLHVPK